MPPIAKRKIQLDLTDPAFDPVYVLADRTYPGAPSGPSTVARELLLTALGSDPLDAAKVTARRVAYYEALVVARAGLGRALLDVARQLQSDAVAAEAFRMTLASEEPTP